MKRATIGLCIVCLVAALPSALGALEIGTTFYLGNLAFSDERAAGATDLPAIFPWGGSVVAYQQIDSQIAVNIGFYSDPTLNYVSYTLLDYRLPYFSISVGPFFGFFNSRNTLLKPGISTAVRADIPGLAFVSFRADSSIGGRLVEPGDYIQERSDVAVGFYVPNAIASVNLMTKSYISRTDTEEMVDSYLEYSFRTDLFRKNVPYRVLLSFAYQERAKSFVDVTRRDAAVHRLSSLVLGTEVELQFSDWIVLELALDSSIYSFGNVDLRDGTNEILALPTSGIEQYLFNASLGVRVQVDSLRRRTTGFVQ
jgi:hypothetical protein